MIVCFIAEGSYPYVMGGVSSWVDSFIKWFGENEFKLISIGPFEEKKGQYAYVLPPNVSCLSEIFFDTPFNKQSSKATRQPFYTQKFLKTPEEKAVLSRHFLGELSDWIKIFEIARRIGRKNIRAFFSGREFIDIVTQIYEKEFEHVPFVEFIWLMRSMFIYQFWSLNVEIPEADIYHSVSAGYAGLVGALASHLYNKPFVMTEHGIYAREREEEIVKSSYIKDYARDLWVKYFYNMSFAAYRFARTVVTLFEKNKFFQVDLGCPENKIFVVPNGIDISAFSASLCGDARKNRDYKGTLIGAVIRVVPIKDIVTMLQGFMLAKKNNSELKLLLMGPQDEDEEYFKYCEEYIVKNDIQDVEFTGRVNVKEYLPQIDMLLLTSISEAQPLSLLEAMAFQIPVISTDVGCCNDIVYGNGDDFGDAGIVTPIMDPNALAFAIEKLAADPELRAQMGISGRKRVERYYTKDNFIEGYKLIYSILAGGNNGRNWFSIEEAHK